MSDNVAAEPAAPKGADKPVKKKTRKPGAPRNYSLGNGIYRFSRSRMYHKKALYKFKGKKIKPAKKPRKALTVEKQIGGEKNGGKRVVLLRKRRNHYGTVDKIKKPRAKKLFKNHTRYLRSSLTPGTILILLAGVHKGKRVILLKALASGLLLVTGPFVVNACPLRRIHQRYVIATSTKLDISKVKSHEHIDDKYFRRERKKRAKKEEGDIFSTKKEAYKASPERKSDQKKVDKEIVGLIRKHPDEVPVISAFFDSLQLHVASLEYLENFKMNCGSKQVSEEVPSQNTQTKSTKKVPDGSSITICQFLDFLKTAYQVTGSIEAVLLADGMTKMVDWIKLKESELVKPRDFACQADIKDTKKKSDVAIASVNSSESIKRKLSEVLSEGILDSVLDNMVALNASCPVVVKKSQPKVMERSQSHSSLVACEKGPSRRRSVDVPRTCVVKSNSEVVLHVCDEVKNAKKDFVCNQNLLVEKMGYFAQVTEGQRLEDMDISVHCDVGIFEWLICWVKKDVDEEQKPELDPQCVVPILVSAAFLQMEPLLEECLLFCHEHMNDILRTSTNVSCLNDAVMTRLAAMYTNTEVEAIRDRKDKIQSRLYCKLIQSLCEPETESMRGHWNSLAQVYRCCRCQKLVNPATGAHIPCIAACMRLRADGLVTYKHEYDNTWDINEHIDNLYKTLKTWRKIYWHLWGDAHFLFCTVCKRFFPSNQVGWCRYHPDSPQFFTVDAQRPPLPVGRYPCCGERAFRFELIERETGCQFREHSPVTDNVRDTAVLALLENFRSLIEEEPVKMMFPERLTRLVPKGNSSDDADTCEGTSENESFWWDGFVLIPERPKLGLLGRLNDAKQFSAKFPQQLPLEIQQEGEEEEGDASDSSESSVETISSGGTSGSSINSGTSSRLHKSEGSDHSVAEKEVTDVRKSKKKSTNRLWQDNLSARSNQDLQRTYEETVLKQIQAVLTRRSFLSVESTTKASSKGWPRHITPPGGLWVRLESEWKERNSNVVQSQKLRNVYGGRSKIKTARFS
ncbi:hypothetical protein FQA39_LY16810 [Lamprigera yunnana]|nr:hypothetical protein FQA39_LY16810 [Lamprigera yunnana]